MKWHRTQTWMVQLGPLNRYGRITKPDNDSKYYWFVKQQKLDLGLGDSDTWEDIAQGQANSLKEAKAKIREHKTR